MANRFEVGVRLSFGIFWVVPAIVLSACGKPPAPARGKLPPQVEIVSVPPFPRTQAEACAAFEKELPPDFFRDRIKVPENWDEPTGRQIEVFFYGRVSETIKTPPVIFFNGGPGGSSHSSYDIFESKRLAKKDLNILFIDQRGTGCSTPYPHELTRESVKRISFYSNRSIVRDAEALRKKLFGDKVKWRVFGQSYGGDIVHRYIEVASDSIDAAYAHGSSLVSPGENEQYYRLKSQKRLLDAYFKVHPGDEKVLQRIRDAVSESLCFSDGLRKICGDSIIDRLVQRLGWNQWTALHESIEDLDPIARNSDVKRSFRQALTEFVIANYFHASEPYYELPSTILRHKDFPPGTCDDAIERHEAEGEKPSQWLLRECRFSGESFYDTFLENLWPEIETLVPRDTLSLEKTLKELTRNPIPFFLYSGKLDAFVPVESFASEIKALAGKITYREFPNSGHEGYSEEDQVWEDLKR